MAAGLWIRCGKHAATALCTALSCAAGMMLCVAPWTPELYFDQHTAFTQILACAPSLELAADHLIAEKFNLHSCYVRVLGSQSKQSSITDAGSHMTFRTLARAGPTGCIRCIRMVLVVLADEAIHAGQHNSEVMHCMNCKVPSLQLMRILVQSQVYTAEAAAAWHWSDP